MMLLRFSPSLIWKRSCTMVHHYLVVREHSSTRKKRLLVSAVTVYICPSHHCKSVSNSLAITLSHNCIDCQAITISIPGSIVQSVTCLATDASLTADPGVASLIPAQSHTFVFLQSFSFLPLNHSRRIFVSCKRKYVHEVLVNCLFKLAWEKKCS